jgi:hypothetical protein
MTEIIDKPNFKPCWTKNPVSDTPVIFKANTQNRFECISSFLYFSCSSMYHTSAERLHKIMPVLKRLSYKFSALYISEQRLALDEGMLAWRGRLSF